MRIGSLFSGGCGGLELGLERAGVGHVVWQCEIDAAARRNLARHWPGVKQYTDVKEMNHGNTERVDVICGGSPCQDLSFAGKGAGLAGTRSGLWFEYLRVVRELRPRYVVIENVPALLVRGLDVVLGGLAESGYDAVWFTLRASDVGATHRRERLFVVAYRDGQGEPQPEGAESHERGWVGDGGGDVVDTDGVRNRWFPPVKVEPSHARAADRGSFLGHANGARLEGRSVRRCGRADERALGVAGSEVADAASLRRAGLPAVAGGAGASEGEGRVCQFAGGGHEFPPGPGDHDGWREYLARFPNRAPAILTPMPANRHGNARRCVSLNPAFVESLMGFPEDWTKGTRSERLKQLGNAVVPQCAEVVGHVLLGLHDRLR